MRAALERPGTPAGRAAANGAPGTPGSAWVSPALLAGLAVLVAAALFAGGGSSNGAVFPIGVGAVGLAVAASLAVLAGVIPAPRVGPAGAACLVLLTLLVAWDGLSVIWSIAPDRSWGYANRGLAYLAFLVIGVLAGAVARRAPTLVAGGLSVFVAAALAWALAGKIAPGLSEDGGRIARLRVPIGYWNGLALLVVLGVPLALWLAADRRRRHALRAAGVALLCALLIGLLLTYSRGGILAAIAAFAVWLVLSSNRLESVAAVALASPFAAGVLAFAFGRPGIVEDGQNFAARSADGKAFGLAVGLGLAGAFVATLAASRLEARRPLSENSRARLARAGRIALAGLAVAAVVLIVVRFGWVERQVDEFANPPTELVTQAKSRLTSFSSNNRWAWWNEAWKAFRAEPVLGLGAASFPTAHRILRSDPLTVTTPHNFPLQLLAETGVVGLLLGCGAALAALAGVFRALRRLDGGERAAAAALVSGIVAFVLHSLVDFDWDFLALAAPVLVATGVLLAAGRPAGPAKRSLGWAIVPMAALGAAIVSLASPWLADGRVDAAYAALGAGHPRAGLAAADRARSLNPLALDPLFASASAHVALGDVDGARRALIAAVELQPLDANAWYELGAFELEVAGRPLEAVRYLERSRELDRYGPAPVLLAKARAAAAAA